MPPGGRSPPVSNQWKRQDGGGQISLVELNCQIYLCHRTFELGETLSNPLIPLLTILKFREVKEFSSDLHLVSQEGQAGRSLESVFPESWFCALSTTMLFLVPACHFGSWPASLPSPQHEFRLQSAFLSWAEHMGTASQVRFCFSYTLLPTAGRNQRASAQKTPQKKNQQSVPGRNKLQQYQVKLY